MDSFEIWVGELCQREGCDDILVESGLVIIDFDDGLRVIVDLNEDGSGLTFSAALGELADDGDIEKRAGKMEVLLCANSFEMAADNGRIGLDPENGVVMLTRTVHPEAIRQATDIQLEYEKFIAMASSWKQSWGDI